MGSGEGLAMGNRWPEATGHASSMRETPAFLISWQTRQTIVQSGSKIMSIN